MKTQTENTQISGKRIQYWHNGIMMGLMPRAIADQQLEDGDAYIITSQAIGAMIDGKKRGAAYR